MKNFDVNTKTYNSLEDDLQKLISIIRERQSSLLLLFQEKQQKDWGRPQWLIKQCEYQQKQNRYSRQIRRMILQWALMSNQQNYEQSICKILRSFWIKVKMVIKMSLQRIKILNLLSYQLFQKYEAIIEALNVSYDRVACISHYRDIEEMIKGRNRLIHENLNYKTTISSKEKFNILVGPKAHLKESLSQAVINKLLIAKKTTDHNKSLYQKILIPKRPLSHNIRSLAKNGKRQLTKGNLNVQKLINNYQQNLKGAVDGKIDIFIDKKKLFEDNVEDCYDQLFKRNVVNHKIISKYIFYQTGRKIGKLLSKKKQKNHIKKLNQDQNYIFLKKLKNNKDKLYRRTSSAKLKSKQIHRIKNNPLFDTGIKTLRFKKCI